MQNKATNKPVLTMKGSNIENNKQNNEPKEEEKYEEK